MYCPQEIQTLDASLPETKGSTHHVLSVEFRPTLADPTKYSFNWKLLLITAWNFAPGKSPSEENVLTANW
jgi:hypothetical protein